MIVSKSRRLPLSQVFIYYLSFSIVLLPWQNIRTRLLLATVVRIWRKAFLRDQTEKYGMFLYSFPAYGTFVAYKAGISHDSGGVQDIQNICL